MFSANENLVLRQHKRRIVDRIEKAMPEEALDMGTTVMVMQVSCKDPGCVPLETAVIIIFPNCGEGELIPGLPESNGGNYKTKILKPMADVTEDDILDNLPPAFEGGRRTMERVCMYARDVMIAQITQLFGDGSDGENDSSVKDRAAMATYLQACLQDYIAGGCIPPPYGEPNPNGSATAKLLSGESSDEPVGKDESSDENAPIQMEQTIQSKNPEAPTAASIAIPSKGNIVIRRKVDDDSISSNPRISQSHGIRSGSTTSIRIRQPPQHERGIQVALLQQNIGEGRRGISSLFEREHAPGIRKPGCPCCDPDDAGALADTFIMM